MHARQNRRHLWTVDIQCNQDFVVFLCHETAQFCVFVRRLSLTGVNKNELSGKSHTVFFDGIFGKECASVQWFLPLTLSLIMFFASNIFFTLLVCSFWMFYAIMCDFQILVNFFFHSLRKKIAGFTPSSE